MAKSDKSRKIGIFGGTFNPVHIGHLINIEFTRDFFALDKVFLIPAKIPVHKEIEGGVSPADRFRMVELAVADNPFIEASSIEIDRDSPSYTITTINELHEIYPDDELFLILGADSFNELDTWKSYEDILKRVSIIVMKRPGSPVLRNDIKKFASGIYEIENPLIDLSSTIIRNRIKQGRTVRYLTSDEILGYIEKKRLYQN